MITGLLLHLQKDTEAKEGVIYAYKQTGVPNIYVNENGIEASKDLIKANEPQVIVIHDEPDFMHLADYVGTLSPHSLNIIDRSVYDGTGIKIRKKTDYERLKELGFVIYRSGFELNEVSEALRRCNTAEFESLVKEKYANTEPFEVAKQAFREMFEHNYHFI